MLVDPIEKSCLYGPIGGVKVLSSIGDEIEMYWSDDKEFYPGKLLATSPIQTYLM